MIITPRQTLLTLLIPLTALACGPSPTPGNSELETLAFVHVGVIPMDSERVLDDHTVLIKGGKIVALGPSSEVQPPVGAHIVDAGGGHYLLPGLFDTHVHLNQQEDDAHLALYLAAGVTTVQSMHGSPWHLETRRRVEGGELLGPRILTTGPTTATAGINTPEKAEALVRAQKAAGYDAVKMYGDGNRSMTEATYARVISAAHDQGLRVVGHAPRNHPFSLVLGHGQDSIDHLEEIIYTYQPIVDVIGPLLDLQFGRVALEDVADALAALPDLRPQMASAVEKLAAEALAAGLAVTPTLVTFETIWRQTTAEYDELLKAPEMRYISPMERAQWGPEFNTYRRGWSDRLEAIEKILRRSFELQKTIVRGFQEAGVPLMVGTDAPLTFVYPGFAVHQELALFVDSGLSPYEALRAATVTPAKELGLEDVGTIAIGRRADLVLVEGNPLTEIANASQVTAVVTGGRLLTRDELDLRLEELARSYEPLAKRLDVLMAAYRQGDAEEIGRAYRSMEEPGEALARFTEDRLLNSLGYRHLGDGDVERAVEIFRLSTEIFPEVANSWDSLGESLMSAEDWQGALASYRRALELDPDNENGRRKIEWLEATLLPRDPPLTLSVEQLEPLVGDYGPRHVRLRGGQLYYQRDDRDEFRLVPMTRTLFALEGYADFRLGFELGEDGRASKAIGLYVDGRVEESPRQGSAGTS